MSREPVTLVKLIMDYCPLTFGSGACTAALGPGVVRKCYNTFPTCRKVADYQKSTITYTFMTPRPNYPKGATVFPYLISTSGKSATVNIAGADPDMDNLGVRGEVTATFSDHPYHDRFSDKYYDGRVSGLAQTDEPGYLPQSRGTFWTKFKARNPNYAGRPMIIQDGYLENGLFTSVTERHHVIYEIAGPGDGNTVTVRGKDILYLADNDKAVCPKFSNGILLTAVTAEVGQTFTLNPVGIGSEYATEGFGTIGSELAAFTRVGDVVTLTARGQSGTVAAAHDVNDTFQQSFSPRRKRADLVIADLLINFANIPASEVNVTEWAEEFDTWAPQLDLTADILKPEGVSKLIGEMAVLGITIWRDEVAQKIRLRVERPPELGAIKKISGRNNILKISQKDYDDKRLTNVTFYTKVIDPTKSVTDSSNYQIGYSVTDAEAVSPFSYGDTKSRNILCRWLNHGDTATAQIMSKRLLNRFKDSPARFTIDLDIEDDVKLADIIEVDSRVVCGETGLTQPTLMQVISREDLRNGHDFRVVAQSFDYTGRYGYITENGRPDFATSSDAQKLSGFYITENNGTMPDGSNGYVLI